MNSSTPAPSTLIHPRAFAEMPIKGKLMVIIMGVTIAALLTTGVGMLIVEIVLFRGYVQRDLSGLAEMTAANSTAALSFQDPAAANETLATLRIRPHVVVACIYGSSGELFARYSRDRGNDTCPRPAAASQVRLEDRDILVSRPILLRNQRIGTLVLMNDLGELQERITLYGMAALLILLVSSLVALLLSTHFQKIIATPILALAGTTAAVSRTKDYRLRAEKMSRDELGTLVEGFNGMLAGIQSRDQNLRDALHAREQALSDAQNARDFLKTTLASIGDAVISTDAEGRIVFANAVASSLVRWPQEEISGRPLDEVLHLINEQTRAPVENPVSQVLREGAIVALANHTILIGRDGFELPIDDSAAPIRNPGGELVGVVLIFRDITERKRAEQELRSAREQLQLVTDNMAPCVTHASRDFTYQWVSPRFAEWLRLPPGEIAGRKIEEVLGSEAFYALQPYFERVLAGARMEYEIRVNLGSIGVRWIHGVDVPTHGRDGSVNGWVSHLSDFTALKSAETEVARINADLKRSNERLARTNKDLEGFAFAASHDLQEPLRMVSTYAQLLVRTYPERFEGEGNIFIQNIVDGAMRMRTLLTDLLAYSEIEAEQEQTGDCVDLNAVIDSVRENLKVTMEETGATVLCQRLPVVRGHRSHFVQLFQNLVGNAIKYRANEQPRIRISCESVDREFRFEVTDNGIGIEPAYHDKIFGVFKRLHGKKIPGNGIGLAICQRVVERYHGRIWVESEFGRGSTFYFTLPASVEAEEIQ